IPHVGLHREHPASTGAGYGLLSFTRMSEKDIPAGTRKTLHDRLAQTPAAACHDRGFAPAASVAHRLSPVPMAISARATAFPCTYTCTLPITPRAACLISTASISMESPGTTGARNLASALPRYFDGGPLSRLSKSNSETDCAMASRISTPGKMA